MDLIERRVYKVSKEDLKMPWQKVVSRGSWLFFDEVLTLKEFEQLSIYDCVAHYPILIDAIKNSNTEFLDFCPLSAVVFIRGLPIEKETIDAMNEIKRPNRGV